MASGAFWTFREPNRGIRAFRVLFGLLAVPLAAGALVWSPPGRPVEGVFVLGLLAWVATSQGLSIFAESYLSLELGVYLWAFLCFDQGSAMVALATTTVLSIVQKSWENPADLDVEFIVRKTGNLFVLGLSLMAACAAYAWAGGGAPLELLSRQNIGALVLFWAAFTVVNNLLWAPIDLLREGKGFLRRFIPETALDGALHALSMLSGIGFAMVYPHLGVAPILLALPVILVALVALHRATVSRKVLTSQLSLLQRLNEGSASLHQSLDQREVLDAVEQVCRGLFSADTFFLALLDERTGRVEYARAVEQDKVLQLGSADLNQGLTGHVMRTGQAIFTGDAPHEAPWNTMVRRVGDDRHPIRSLMMAPLANKGRTIGVLSVQSLQAHAYKPFEKELFLAVCQQVVTAVAGARLYRRATEDFLTRLYNKSYFEERLQTCLADGESFGLIFMDCDDFKAVNDRHGHVVGDQYLEALGRRLMGLCRGSDVPCRYGGDEFAILLPGATGEQTLQVAVRVREAVAGLEFAVGGRIARTTVSLGTLWSDGTLKAVPVEDVLRKVDQALYRAKTRKNTIEEAAL